MKCYIHESKSSLALLSFSSLYRRPTLLPAFQNIVLIYSESLQTMKIDIILKTEWLNNSATNNPSTWSDIFHLFDCTEYNLVRHFLFQMNISYWS